MSNLKEIRTRIASVTSTRQITSAMKMVSAAKLRKAQDAIIQLRPYTEKMNEILANLSSSVEALHNHEFSGKAAVHKILIVVITSNKGLCGAFNTNVVKAAINLAQTKYKTQFDANQVFFYCIGKKGYDQLKTRKVNIIDANHKIFDFLSFDNSLILTKYFVKSFINEEFDVVELVYNQFKNAAVQILTVEQLLPVDLSSLSGKVGSTMMSEEEYILEPSKEYIIQTLIPKLIRLKFYKSLLDSVTSEHGARMTAMHQATDNATEMLRELKLNYNKARQAAITKELIEIVSGAEALKV